MTQKTSFSAIIWFLMIFILLTACGGRQLEVESISKTEHPQQLINQLDNEVALARNENINVLSPTWFAKAESSLNEAKKLLEEGAELSKIFDKIANSRAELNQAKKIAEVSKVTLAEAIQGRELARKAGAAALGNDYQAAEEAFLDLSRAIEKENLRYAQRNQAAVTEQFR